MTEREERTGAEEPAAAAWAWARDAVPEESTSRGHRVTALLQLALAVAVAAVLALVASPRWAIVPLAAGVALAAITWLSPRYLYPRVLAALRGIGRAAGWLTTWLLLTPFYYLALAPFGLLCRRGRRDPLDRRRAAGETSYWVSRAGGSTPPEHYERQF